MDKLNIIKDYLISIYKENSADFISDDILYMVESLDESFSGKDFYLERTKAFYNNTTSNEIKRTVVGENEIFLVVRYEICSPKGTVGKIDVAELFALDDNNRIDSHAIFFDSASFGKFMSS